MNHKIGMPELRFPGFKGEWKHAKLGQVCDKIQDGNYGGEYPKADEFVETGIPFLTSKALGGDGFLKEDKIDFISIEKHIKLKKAQLKLNDVLFTNRGSNVGSIGFTDIRIAHGNIGPQLTLLRSDLKIITPFFLYQIMKSEITIKQIRSQDSGSAMNFFGINTTSKFKLSLPTLPEQQKIASFLSAVDEKIQHLSRKKELLEQYKKGVMQQLFSGKLRFKDENGKDYADWEEKKLGDVLDQQIREINKPLEKYLAIGIRSHVKGTFQKPDSDPSKIAMDKLFVVKENDLIVNITFAWEGAIAIVKKEDDGGLVSHRFPTYTFNSKYLLQQYFAQVIIDKKLRMILDLISPGGAGRNRVLSKKEFVKIEWSFPCIEEQQKIADFLSSIDAKVESVNQQINQTQSFKKGLLQQMFV
jgi:type I restriction enzyme S subunit